MFQKDKWPFTPVCLREIIDKDTLAVIESGCCERLGRPLTILDCDPETEGFDRIESINEKQRYEPFCGFLRNEQCVKGGDKACKEWDLEQARISLQEFHKTGIAFRAFHCHMGVQDMTYIICIKDRPVAIVFSGQYCPAEGISYIEERIRKSSSGSDSPIKLSESACEQLLSLARQLPAAPKDAPKNLEREAQHIQRIAEAEFERGKRQWEQDFLDELRTGIRSGKMVDLGQLRRELGHILQAIKTFCRCDYVVFFASVHEGDTVLAPIAEAGVFPTIGRARPHFNWKKAGLPIETFEVNTWEIARWHHSVRNRGIRGDNSEYLAGADCVIPTSLGDRYRGALVLGPFAEQVNIQEEQRFLIEVANTVGSFALTELEVLDLEREHRRWRSTAALLTHQVRTTLTPIATQVGRAKALAQRSGKSYDSMGVIGSLSKAEDLAIRLSQGVKETLAGYVLQLEAEDLEFERYPLSVLVGNCAFGFIGQAEKRNLRLVIDDGIEFLPEADVDVAHLTIALANLIENAIKYSYPGRTIYIRAHYDPVTDPNLGNLVIEVDNLGYEIQPEDQERIFEQSTRGLTAAKLGRIPGSGLGLWEARAVMAAHGGEIGVRCDKTAVRIHGNPAYHVVFWIRIPLRRSK